LLALFVASLVACIAVTTLAPRFAFYYMPLRGWELLAGGLIGLGLIPEARRAWVRQLESALGLALIGWAIARFSSETTFPGVNALIPCAGTALIIHAHTGTGSPTTIVGHLLKLRPIVFLGTISYSLYLWHWPLIVFSKYWIVDPQPEHMAAVGFLTLVVSTLSWKYVEQPFRRPTWLPRRTVFGGFAVATILTVGFGVATSLTSGWPDRVSAEVLALDQAANDFNQDRPRCHAFDRRPIRFDDKCVFGQRDVDPTIAIWGDSMAAELAVALGRDLGARHRSVLSISYSSCPPSVGLTFSDRPRCKDHNLEVLNRLVESKTITKVILVALYKRYHKRLGAPFLHSFEDVVTTLTRAGKQVYIVYPIPTPLENVPAMLARYALLDNDLRRAHIDRAGYDADNRDTIAALDAELLCTAARCEVLVEDKVMYFDDLHLSVAGATYLMPAFRAVIE
jgi:hypothetical protein